MTETPYDELAVALKEIDEKDWTPASKVTTNRDPKRHHLFGHSDAKAEWRNEHGGRDVFIHTKSYEQFKEPYVLSLYGRRGTGKSSILNMLHYEIRNRKSAQYGACWLINDEDAYSDFVVQLRVDQLAQCADVEIRNFLAKIWTWVIQVSAMQAVVWQCRHEDDCEKQAKLRCVVEYLARIGLCKSDGKPMRTGAVAYAAEVLVKTWQREQRVNVVMYESWEKLNSQEYKDALEALTNDIDAHGNSCLVMLDSIEEYPLHDRMWQLNVLGLFQAAKFMHDQRDKRHIVVKIALPSELRAHVKPVAHDKYEEHELYIFWQYKDLISMAAKRLDKSLGTDKFEPTDPEDSHVDHDEAVNYLYGFMPHRIQNRLGDRFDTLAYIFRHSQKRPRQIVKLMNRVFDESAALRDSGTTARVAVSAKEIVHAVHEISSNLAEDAFDNYNDIYKTDFYGGAQRIARVTLKKQPNVFRWGRVTEMMKAASQLRDNYSVDDIKRMLIEAGVIGCITATTRRKEFIYLDIEYEYQVRGTMEIRDNDYVSVHPMFYCHYESYCHPKLIPHPRPSEAEEQLLFQQRQQ